MYFVPDIIRVVYYPNYTQKHSMDSGGMIAAHSRIAKSNVTVHFDAECLVVGD